jgi:hypothetical protein
MASNSPSSNFNAFPESLYPHRPIAQSSRRQSFAHPSAPPENHDVLWNLAARIAPHLIPRHAPFFFF